MLRRERIALVCIVAVLEATRALGANSCVDCHQRAVTVVSVIPPLPLGMSSQPVPPSGRGKQVLDLVEKEAERAAAQAAERLRQQGFYATAVVAHGQPAHELISTCPIGAGGADRHRVARNHRRNPLFDGECVR